MLKKTRTILFSICAILFFLVAPSVVLYSQGFRFDFDSKKVVQIGGFYFKVLPKSAKIFIDGEFKKSTDFIFGSVLIGNLLPKKYKIEIKKEGYFPWQKTLEIKEKEITKAENIILIPQKIDFNLIDKEVEDFFFSPDEKKIILKSGNDLKILAIEKESESYLIKDVFKERFDFLVFSNDSKRSLLKLNSKYQILELDKAPFFLTSIDFLEPGIKDMSFYPRDSTKMFFLKNNELLGGDLKKEQILPLLKDVLAYQISGENIYYLDNSGNLFKTDFSFQFKEKINGTSLEIKEKASYQLNIFDNFIFLKEVKEDKSSSPPFATTRVNEKLYLFNPETKSFEKFFEPIKSLKVSPDFKKMVYFNNFEIGIFFLQDVLDQPQKRTGERVFLTRFSEKIGDSVWFDFNYLIFNSGSKIKIAEIDDRDRINIYEITSPITNNSEGPKIFFNVNNKKVYILSEGNLFISEKILP